jgi:hypothetical protein
VGISLLAFALTVVISLSPTEAEMREDAALMAHLSAPPQERPVGAYRPARPGQEAGDPDAGRWFRAGH